MPITPELENTRRLKSVGFTEEQAETLTELIEGAQQHGFDRFADVLERSIGELRAEMRSELAQMRAEMRAELQAGLREQMLRFITILVALLSVAVAIIKLFPNLG